MSQGGSRHHRDRLRQVGPHQLRRLECGVEEQQHHDDQRPGTHRRHPDDQTSCRTECHGRGRSDHDLRCAEHGRGTFARDRRALDEHHPRSQHQCARGRQQGHAQGLLDDGCQVLSVADQPQNEHTRERGRYRADAQPLHQGQVDGSSAQVDEGSHGLHEQAGHQVAGHRRERVHAEEEHQNRRHQRATAHAGEPDEDAHHQAGQGQAWVEPVHQATFLTR
jgi:hypothetical protein